MKISKYFIDEESEPKEIQSFAHTFEAQHIGDHFLWSLRKYIFHFKRVDSGYSQLKTGTSTG